MDSTERLIEDWIQIRTTLKRQLKDIEESGVVTADAKQRIHRCVTELELLITLYSSRV